MLVRVACQVFWLFVHTLINDEYFTALAAAILDRDGFKKALVDDEVGDLMRVR